MTSAWDLAVALKPTIDAVGASDDAIVGFAVEGPTLNPVIDRASSDATVQMQPWSETEETQDRGDMLAGEREINFILQCPMENAGAGTCMLWLNQVKEAFRELELELPDGTWKWRGNETLTLFDSDAAKDMLQFISQFRATFYNFA